MNIWNILIILVILVASVIAIRCDECDDYCERTQIDGYGYGMCMILCGMNCH